MVDKIQPYRFNSKETHETELNKIYLCERMLGVREKSKRQSKNEEVKRESQRELRELREFERIFWLQ